MNLRERETQPKPPPLPPPPSTPMSPDLDTSTANYNEIFLPDEGNDDHLFFSPLPRSKQLAATAARSWGPAGPPPPPPPAPPSSSDYLQEQVLNFDPDTRFPEGYFSIPSLPPPTTEAEPEHDEPDEAYVGRLAQRSGFFLQPDLVTVDELVTLLRRGCLQVVALNRRDHAALVQMGGLPVPPPPPMGDVDSDGVVTVAGMHTFSEWSLVPSGAAALDAYLTLHGRTNKVLRCGVYGCASPEEAMAVRLAAIAIRSDMGHLYVSLSATPDPRAAVSGPTQRRIVVFAPRAGVLLDTVIQVVPAATPALKKQTKPQQLQTQQLLLQQQREQQQYPPDIPYFAPPYRPPGRMGPPIVVGGAPQVNKAQCCAPS